MFRINCVILNKVCIKKNDYKLRVVAVAIFSHLNAFVWLTRIVCAEAIEQPINNSNDLKRQNNDKIEATISRKKKLIEKFLHQRPEVVCKDNDMFGMNFCHWWQ